MTNAKFKMPSRNEMLAVPVQNLKLPLNSSPIGILDSGVGGLTIWKEIVAQLPTESTIYIADSKNCPYGTRPYEEIYALSKRMVKFLIDKGCKLIVVGCNTITVNCLDALRKDFPKTPIVGIVPVVKTASEQTKNGKIGILSTTSTADSDYQKQLIALYAGDCTVVNLGTDKLVPLVEAGRIKVETPLRQGSAGQEVEKVLREVLEPFKEAEVDTLALGCSHFPFLKMQMQEILGPEIKILDSAGAIARQVGRVLVHERLQSTDNSPRGEAGSLRREFYTTGDEVIFSKILASIGYNQNVQGVEL